MELGFWRKVDFLFFFQHTLILGTTKKSGESLKSELINLVSLSADPCEHCSPQHQSRCSPRAFSLGTLSRNVKVMLVTRDDCGAQMWAIYCGALMLVASPMREQQISTEPTRTYVRALEHQNTVRKIYGTSEHSRIGEEVRDSVAFS